MLVLTVSPYKKVEADGGFEVVCAVREVAGGEVGACMVVLSSIVFVVGENIRSFSIKIL